MGWIETEYGFYCPKCASKHRVTGKPVIDFEARRCDHCSACGDDVLRCAVCRHLKDDVARCGYCSRPVCPDCVKSGYSGRMCRECFENAMQRAHRVR